MKFDVPAGEPYMFRERNVDTNPLDKIFQALLTRYNELVDQGQVHPEFPDTAKKNFDFCGELYLGHLRYGTHGGNSIDVCHPYERPSNWPSRYLSVAGNFNLTNTHEIFEMLVSTIDKERRDLESNTTQALGFAIHFFTIKLVDNGQSIDDMFVHAFQ